MQTVFTGEKSRWAVAAIVASLVLCALLLLFRAPPPPAAFSGRVILPPSQARPAPVQVARPSAADLVLSEEMVLRDMRPLFVPTQWNVSAAEPKREPGRSFLENETVKLHFAEADLAISRDLPPIATIAGKPVESARPADALAPDATGPSVTGIGRGEVPLMPMARRGGFVEVYSVSTGERMLAEQLPATAAPSGAKPWSPAEFLAAVDAAGLAAPLILTEGSRVEEVDSHFRNYLPRTYRLGERLAPGFYRVVVSP